MISFVESGMSFSFPDDECFVIEKDDIVVSRDCVKACECVALVRHGGKERYMFIEAKSSAPKEKVCDYGRLAYDGAPIDGSWSVNTNFDNFVNDICLKFEDSYSVYMAMTSGYHGRKAADRIPAGCRGVDNENVKFVLIVNGFKDDWRSEEHTSELQSPR